MREAVKRLIDEVYWTPAVFAGTSVGGVVWVVVARYTLFENDAVLTPGQGWLAVGIGCLVVVMLGLALAVCSRTGLVRTVGVAVVVVAMSGGSVLGVWGPHFVMTMMRS